MSGATTLAGRIGEDLAILHNSTAGLAEAVTYTPSTGAAQSLTVLWKGYDPAARADQSAAGVVGLETRAWCYVQVADLATVDGKATITRLGEVWVQSEAPARLDAWSWRLALMKRREPALPSRTRGR